MYGRRALARAVAAGLSLGASAGCAPLTFANDASVDFERYPSVTVQVAGPDGSQRQQDYLERELREHSGFRRVGRAAEGASARLQVELALGSGYDVDLFTDDDVEVEISYSATVRYRLFAADGALVDSGMDSADGEETSFEAAEEALDLVVLHYLRPYRI